MPNELIESLKEKTSQNNKKDAVTLKKEHLSQIKSVNLEELQEEAQMSQSISSNGGQITFQSATVEKDPDKNFLKDLKIEIPKGALSTDTEIQAQLLEHKDIETVIDLKPEGQKFEKPLLIKLPLEKKYDPGTSLQVMLIDPETGNLTPDTLNNGLPVFGTVAQDGNTLEFYINHFSKRTVAAEKSVGFVNGALKWGKKFGIFNNSIDNTIWALSQVKDSLGSYNSYKKFQEINNSGMSEDFKGLASACQAIEVIKDLGGLGNIPVVSVPMPELSIDVTFACEAGLRVAEQIRNKTDEILEPFASSVTIDTGFLAEVELTLIDTPYPDIDESNGNFGKIDPSKVIFGSQSAGKTIRQKVLTCGANLERGIISGEDVISNCTATFGNPETNDNIIRAGWYEVSFKPLSIEHLQAIRQAEINSENAQENVKDKTTLPKHKAIDINLYNDNLDYAFPNFYIYVDHEGSKRHHQVFKVTQYLGNLTTSVDTVENIIKRFEEIDRRRNADKYYEEARKQAQAELKKRAEERRAQELVDRERENLVYNRDADCWYPDPTKTLQRRSSRTFRTSQLRKCSEIPSTNPTPGVANTPLPRRTLSPEQKYVETPAPAAPAPAAPVENYIDNNYSYEIVGNAVSEQGDGGTLGANLKMTASIKDAKLRVKIENKNNRPFSHQYRDPFTGKFITGTVTGAYLKVGTFEPYGVDHDKCAISPNGYFCWLDDNLSKYSTQWEPNKQFYVRVKNENGYAWVGPITVVRKKK